MLSSTTSKITYDITGVTTPIATGYEIPFRIFDSGDVVVTISVSGTETAVETGWTVEVPSSDTGVYKIVFNQGYTFPEGATKLTISRDVPIEQDVDLRNGDAFDGEVLEEMFDRQTAVSQQIAEEANRALKFPISETPDGSTLPEASQRQKKVIGFGENGTDLVLYDNIDDGIAASEAALEQANEALEQASQIKASAEAAREGAEEAEAGAEQALQDTIQAKADALTAIGEDNQSGARGDAIEAIGTQESSSLANIKSAENTALASIGQSDSAGARGSAISSINSAKTAALSEIETVKEAALDAVGESDTEGARGEAISSIEAKAASANTVIDGKVDTASDAASAAAGSAAAALQSERNADQSEINAKNSENAAKGSETAAKASETASAASEAKAKASETKAKASENAALASKNAAASSETAAADSESNALQYKNAAEAAKTAAETAQGKAEAAQAAAEKAAEDAAAIADIDIATPTTPGITKMYTTARGQNTDGAVTQKAINDELTTVDGKFTEQGQSISDIESDLTQAQQDISSLETEVGKKANASDVYTKSQTYSRTEIDGKLSDAASILPIPLVSAEFTSTGTGLQIVMNNNYIGYGNVTVRYKIGNDPSETDTVASFPITNVQTGTYYFRAFPASGSLDEPSPSAILALDTSKVMTPTYQWDNITDSISFACQTPAADIRYTTDGLEPSATSGTPYTGPIALTSQTTFKVKAFKGGMADSDTLSVTITKVATPTFSFVKNGETGTVTMGCSTASAVIKYTTDGSEPTEQNGTVYSGAITLNGTSTKYRIKAFLSGCIDSEEIQGDAVFAQIFAVQWNYGASPSNLTRLTPDTDPLGIVTETISTEPVIATSSGGGSSPFDAYGPWNGMKRRNFVDNGSGVFIPDAWEGEEGFTTTGKDTMVWIPPFYVKTVDDASSQLRTYYLANDAMEGFTLHPGSGMYVGAYVTSNNNQSMAGKSFQVSQSIVTMRTNAKAKGAGWGLIDWAARSALQYLFIVEFASWNSQVLFNQTSGTQNQTGLTDSLPFHTGYNGKVVYRHVEDLWNGVYEWTDGVNVIGGQVYISTDRENYQSDITEGYTLISGCAGTNYNIQKLKYDASNPWCIGLPEYTSGGDYSSYIGDDGNISNGTYVLRCGGLWASGSYHGLFYFVANVSSSYTNSSHGSRLSYKEAV